MCNYFVLGDVFFLENVMKLSNVINCNELVI